MDSNLYLGLSPFFYLSRYNLMEYFAVYGIIGLFLAAFLAATVLPFSSEFLLVLFVSQSGDWLVPLFVVSAGNILGSITNYYLGFYGHNFIFYRLFKMNEKTVENAINRFNRYGIYSMLFAWVPVVGDPLTVAAGIFKVRFSIFLILVSIGKIARYVLLIIVTLNLI